MPRCHRRLQGWKKEGNEPMTDVERKGRTVEILSFFPNTLENVETLRLCLNEFPMNYIFFFAYFYIFCIPWRFWDEIEVVNISFAPCILLIPNFFIWSFLFFFRGKYLEPKGFTRGESTPKDETILQRSGVRGDEASCDILAPSSKIVSFERIANARVLFPRMRKVDSRDTR